MPLRRRVGDWWYRGACVFLHVFFTALFGFRVHRLPGARRPIGATLVVANHQSYLDPALVGVASQCVVHFMARRTLFVGPFGWLIRSLCAFPVERGGVDVQAIRSTLELLRAGRAVLVFPEGTRTRDGRLGPLRPGVGLFARRAGVPIVPVYIDGAYRAWPRHQWLPLPAPIGIWFGEPIRIRAGEDDEAAVRRVEAAMRGLESEAARMRACRA